MKKILKFIIRIVLLCIVVGIVVIAKYAKAGYQMYIDAINKKPIVEMVSEIESKENYTRINDVPKIYKEAVVAVEDHRFYIHKGVDVLSIVRAVLNNVKNQDLIEGGSTISQQICKNGYYTLREASNGYFDKEPLELTRYEATMIAGIPNAPSIYNPVNSLELAKERQCQVLYAMVEYGYLTNEEKENIINEDIDLSRFE